MTILSTIKRAWLAQERSRDHAADFVLTIEYASCDLTDLVEPFERNHFLVRRNLKDRIRGRIHDGFPGLDVLRAKVLDDLSSRSRNVAENARH